MGILGICMVWARKTPTGLPVGVSLYHLLSLDCVAVDK